MALLNIGIDLDNTLAGYDHLFTTVALQWGLIDPTQPSGKRAVRAHLVAQGESGHHEWMRLQGQIYGRYMGGAELLPGAAAFLQHCKTEGHSIHIISHKTVHGHFDAQKINLHDAARQWMELQGFFSSERFAIPKEHIHFFPTRDEKVAKIAALNLDYFIDDLEVVLSHPDFPPRTQAIHYLPVDEETDTNSPWITCRHWSEVTEQLFPEAHGSDQPLEQLAGQLYGSALTALQPLEGGGNSNCHQARFDDNRTALLKQYYRYGTDAVERLQRESDALQFLEQQGEKATPALIESTPKHHLILTDFIEGSSATDRNGPDDVAQLCGFIERLHRYSRSDAAGTLGNAREACLSREQLNRQIEQRLKRLAAVAPLHPDLNKLMEQTLSPAFASARQSAPPFILQRRQQTLSPSDFGLHNAIRRDDGNLIFIDFEYFGWDDPVKLTADTLLHPGFALGNREQRQFRQRMVKHFLESDLTFEGRLEGLFPLYVIRWCTIILNEFLPEKWARRAFSGASDGNTIRQQQLEKATTLFHTQFEQRSLTV